MSAIQLREISYADRFDAALYAMMQSIDKDENGFINHGKDILWSQFPSLIEKFIAQRDAPEIKKGYVPQTVFWLLDRDEPIGYSKMRWYLTEPLSKHGGHIGYGIRKEKRRMGYGTRLLGLTLEKIRAIGVDDVLITCSADNMGSRKVIEHNGGELEDEEAGHCRYWIRAASRYLRCDDGTI